MSIDKVTTVPLDVPLQLKLLSNPEDLEHEDLASFASDSTVVSLEKYVALKGELDATNACLKTFQQLLQTSLKRTCVQQDLILRLRDDLRQMDELTDDINYVALRELELKLIQVIKYVDTAKVDFKDGKMSADQFMEGFTTLSSMLEDMEPSGFLSCMFDDLTLEPASVKKTSAPEDSSCQ